MKPKPQAPQMVTSKDEVPAIEQSYQHSQTPDEETKVYSRTKVLYKCDLHDVRNYTAHPLKAAHPRRSVLDERDMRRVEGEDEAAQGQHFQNKRG